MLDDLWRMLDDKTDAYLKPSEDSLINTLSTFITVALGTSNCLTFDTPLDASVQF